MAIDRRNNYMNCGSVNCEAQCLELQTEDNYVVDSSKRKTTIIEQTI